MTNEPPVPMVADINNSPTSGSLSDFWAVSCTSATYAGVLVHALAPMNDLSFWRRCQHDKANPQMRSNGIHILDRSREDEGFHVSAQYYVIIGSGLSNPSCMRFRSIYD
jgi:hypothetical protein